MRINCVQIGDVALVETEIESITECTWGSSHTNRIGVQIVRKLMILSLSLVLIMGAIACSNGGETEAVTPIPSPTTGNIVTFPDYNLKTAIREAISKPAGTIYQSDLANLINIDISAKEIENLIGLEYCTALTELWSTQN